MRLKEDTHSWKASGIKRRDFRHDHSGPEVDTSKVKKKHKPRKKIDHKHIWERDNKPPRPPWWSSLNDEYANIPSMVIGFSCTVAGCQARKYKTNPRYSYEMWKWRRDYRKNRAA